MDANNQQTPQQHHKIVIIARWRPPSLPLHARRAVMIHLLLANADGRTDGFTDR